MNNLNEKQIILLDKIIKEEKECRLYFDEYMKSHKPKERDFLDLLENVKKIKRETEQFKGEIQYKDIDKIAELRDKNKRFAKELEEYMNKRNIREIKDLSNYQAITLKKLFINKYILKVIKNE